MKSFLFLSFILYPALAFADNTITIDCTIDGSTQVFRYIFDAQAHKVQSIIPNDKAEYQPGYGRIYSADVTETTLTAHIPPQPDAQTIPTTFSRQTGIGERRYPNGQVTKFACKPASDTFHKAVLPPDSEGAISATCDLVASINDKQNVGKPLGEASASLVIFTKSKEAFLYSALRPEPQKYSVEYSGPDMMQLCPGGCSNGWLQVNLMNGGGFFYRNLGNNFLPASQQQLICKSAPMPEAAKKKF